MLQRLYAHTHGSIPWRSDLTSALGAVIDGPLISVLVNDPVVDADAGVNADAVFNQLVLIRLVGDVAETHKTQIFIGITMSHYLCKHHSTNFKTLSIKNICCYNLMLYENCKS